MNKVTLLFLLLVSNPVFAYEDCVSGYKLNYSFVEACNAMPANDPYYDTEYKWCHTHINDIIIGQEDCLTRNAKQQLDDEKAKIDGEMYETKRSNKK